jgi:hypothetical protein
MTITLQGDNAWPDLQGKPIIHLGDGAPMIDVAVLDGGMSSGRPSVALRLELPDGRTVIAETSARLFCSTARIIEARFPHLFDDGPARG